MLRVAVGLLVMCASLHRGESRADSEPWPDACESLSPGNGVPPQTGPMPFSLVIDDDVTTSDGCIYLTIKGTETEEFAGFMVQARNDSGIAVGRFLRATDVKTADCFGISENTAININYLSKEEVIMRWLPSGYMGNVILYATVAKDYLEQVYWLKEKTKLITVTKAKYT